MIIISDQEFARLRDFVLKNYGIDLSKKRVLIQGRLTNVLHQNGFTNFSDYIDLVLNDKTGIEVQKMLNRLTTNLTFFMREPEHFRFIKETALPEFDKTSHSNEVRVWSAGCSSGEEPYTLAMTLLDYYEGKSRPKKPAILATDISQNVLGQALRGVYSTDKLSDLPDGWIKKYFDKLDNENYQVKQFVRDLITFRSFNLMDPFKFSRPFELIFCRNVMIYFEKQTKEELVKKFHTWMAPGGYFFVSHSENIGQNAAGLKMMRPSVFKKVVK